MFKGFVNRHKVKTKSNELPEITVLHLFSNCIVADLIMVGLSI